MRASRLQQLRIPPGDAMRAAYRGLASAAKAGASADELEERVRQIVAAPLEHGADPDFGDLAKALAESRRFVPRAEPAPYRQWGEGLEETAVEQMRAACSLPVALRGALMPDAHQGYGLPIGGVLAAENAVIPYAVGMDIACRMKLSVLDLPVGALASREEALRDAVESETRFGVGAAFERRRQHAVMDEDWGVTPLTGRLKDLAWSQLGTSGSGNHFVEFGELSLSDEALGLEPGTYLALLSHSGSRGPGGKVAEHYSRLAASLHPGLPKELQRLAWFDLDSEEGREYWVAMELMGRFAAANHACIHQCVTAHLGARVLADVENHHNFAWLETVDGRPAVVHRKGATPAGCDALGVIPGSMATPAYVVRGKGSRASLCSASHGAGRAMSRKAAKQRFTKVELRAFLADRGVTLLSGGLDECPMAYKDIEKVMAAQEDLVEKLACFVPRLVKMAPEEGD